MKIKAIFLIFGIFFVLFACDSNPYKQGKILYANFCANCHGDNGEGLKGLIPPLASSDYMQQHRKDLPCIIRKGMNQAIVVNGKSYQQAMPSIPNLNFFEITNVLNYIQFGLNKTEDKAIFTADEVETHLKNCP